MTSGRPLISAPLVGLPRTAAAPRSCCRVLAHKDMKIRRPNGKAWPYDERLLYRVGEIVHMRWINASEALHPMHMHGAFYRVDTTSDGQREKVLPPEQRPMVVTQILA